MPSRSALYLRERALLRVAGVLVGIVSAVSLIVWVLNRVDVAHPNITLNLARSFPGRIAASQTIGGVSRKRVLILGDSTLVSYPPGNKVPDRLSEVLERQSVDAPVVVNLAFLGLSCFEYYPFVDRIAATHPTAIVLGFNLQWLSESWRNDMTRPEVLGWLPPRDLPEALALPLHWWNVTADHLLLYSGLVQGGFVEPWYIYRREQVRSGKGLDGLRRLLQTGLARLAGAPAGPATGLPPSPAAAAENRSNRLKADILEELYGTAFAGVDRNHPTLQLLAAILEQLSHDNVPIVVYTVPINIEYMRSVGVVDERGLQSTLATISTIVHKNGGEFVDLHKLLPDIGFRDGPGHFTYETPYDGPLLVAERLAPFLKREALRNM